MNDKHLELCSSAEWADAVRRWIIPHALENLDIGDDVLEIGPGPGRTTEVLCELAPRLTTVDLDADLVAALDARLGGPTVAVLQADATTLPYGDGRFSGVLSFTMLHHLPTPSHQDQVFAEAARVLRSGGVFAGSDSIDSAEFRDLHVDDICVPIEPSRLATRLESAGLTRIAVTTNEYAVRFRGWRP